MMRPSKSSRRKERGMCVALEYLLGGLANVWKQGIMQIERKRRRCFPSHIPAWHTRLHMHHLVFPRITGSARRLASCASSSRARTRQATDLKSYNHPPFFPVRVKHFSASTHVTTANVKTGACTPSIKRICRPYPPNPSRSLVPRR